VRVVHTRVFAAEPGGGNPCPVVVDGAALSDESMLDLARRYGQDTVFVLPPKRGGDLYLRYFVPGHEMGVSGHATIAGVTVALRGKTLPAAGMRVETISGVFDVTAIAGDDDPLVTLEQLLPAFGETVDRTEVARVLHIRSDDVVAHRGPIQSVSVSRAKLLIPLVDWHVLNALAPDYDALWDLCESIGVTGLYPFTLQTNKVNADVEARQFPLRAGFPEDPATGVASAALGAYLARYDLNYAPGLYRFDVAQGYAMGAPSSLHAIVENCGGAIVRTAICGSAQIVSEKDVVI
jgi:trans-2,3-dihydro-3-hydroxyanthranilate isomerase